MMGSGYLGSNMWTLLLLLGLTSAQQQQLLSNEVGVESAGYAEDPNNYYATQYANSGPGTEFYSQYPQETVQAASDTDRITPELVDGAISPVIMVVAFASAVLGSFLAPLIQAVMNAVAEVRIPTFEDFDFPQFPRIKRRRKNDILKKDRTLDDSSLLDSALDKIVESIEDSEYEY